MHACSRPLKATSRTLIILCELPCCTFILGTDCICYLLVLCVQLLYYVEYCNIDPELGIICHATLSVGSTAPIDEGVFSFSSITQCPVSGLIPLTVATSYDDAEIQRAFAPYVTFNLCIRADLPVPFAPRTYKVSPSFSWKSITLDVLGIEMFMVNVSYPPLATLPSCPHQLP